MGTAALHEPGASPRGKLVDRRSDIWAFGCVLYEMLTGKRAFAGDDVTDTRRSAPREWDTDAFSAPAGREWRR
jgi:serine/threonine protein kinase